jgi:hypothetical protein
MLQTAILAFNRLLDITVAVLIADSVPGFFRKGYFDEKVRVEWTVFDVHFMRSPFSFSVLWDKGGVPESGKGYKKENCRIGQQAWSASFIGSGKEYKK